MEEIFHRPGVFPYILRCFFIRMRLETKSSEAIGAEKGGLMTGRGVFLSIKQFSKSATILTLSSRPSVGSRRQNFQFEL
jgi:hypothetical protein